MALATNDRSKSGLQIGAISAIILLAALVVFGLLDRAPKTQVVHRPQLDFSASPLAGGSKSSVDEASRLFPVPTFRPDFSLATDTTIVDVWMRTSDSPQVYIRYDSGIAVTIRPEGEGLGTRAYAEAQLKDGVPGSIVDVDGLEAFEVPQSSEGDLGSIRFVLDGAIVTLIGHGDFPPSVLRSVAQSTIENQDEVRAEHSALG